MKNRIAIFVSLAVGSQALPDRALSQESAPALTNASSSLSTQAQLARDFAMSVGRCDFLILDKNRADLIIFEGCKEAFHSSVFLGEVKKDDPDVTQKITPAGSYRVRVSTIDKPDPKQAIDRYGTLLPFSCDQKNPTLMNCISIHPTLLSPRERKVEVSKKIADRYITNGCVRAEEFPEIEKFVKRQPKEAAFLMVLPYDVSQTRFHLKIPADFQNTPKP